MKILILNNQAPFVRGGAEYLADSLARRLEGRGHLVDQMRIPFKWYPPQAVADHMLACRLLNLHAGGPDLLIALKFPAYLAPFEHKKVWLLHQFRQVYDLWGTPFAGMADTPATRGLRELVVNADNQYLRQCRGLFTNSRIVADRLKTFNGITADEVLYPPLDRPELFRPGECGDYFFYPSRMGEGKRQHLAVEAMRHVRSPFTLVLAGKADGEAYDARLRRQVEELGLGDRVKLLGWVSEERKAELMAGCCGALYLAYQEDSYGYVTLEAFHSAKPVITFTDSGGVDELVEDGENGLVVEPTAEALAGAMEALWARRPWAGELGRAAEATLARKRIDWDHVLDHLLS
jgi:glycosyltransferase involved in cell wall biosynthesis